MSERFPLSAQLRPPAPSLHLARLGLLGLTLSLGACSFADRSLWPSVVGEDPGGPAVSAAPSAAAPQSQQPADLFAPGVGTAGLGSALDRLKADVALRRQEFASLRKQLGDDAASFDSLVSGAESRLGAGTAPNDPQASADWRQAQTTFQRLLKETVRLNTISDWAVSDSALANYVSQAAHTAAAQPEAGQAERRQFAVLESEAGKQAGAVDRLLGEVSGEIATRNLFLSAARRRLTALGPAIELGRRPVPAAEGAGEAVSQERRALVTIRFDRSDVAFEQPLYEAMRAVLEKRPDAVFDVVAVSAPGRNDPAAQERNIEAVVKSLAKMGLPAGRMRLSASTRDGIGADEVRVYLQ